MHCYRRREPARSNEGIAVEPLSFGQVPQLIRSPAGVLPPAAAEINAKLIGPIAQAAFEGAEDGSRDSGGMPIHSHDRAEGLKPKWIAQPGEKLGAPVALQYRLDNRRAELRHPIGEPWRHAAAMQRKIGNSGTFHRAITPRLWCCAGFFGVSISGRAVFSAGIPVARFPCRR